MQLEVIPIIKNISFLLGSRGVGGLFRRTLQVLLFSEVAIITKNKKFIVFDQLFSSILNSGV